MTQSATQKQAYMDEILQTLDAANADNIEQSVKSVVDLCWKIKTTDCCQGACLQDNNAVAKSDFVPCDKTMDETRQKFCFLECQIEKKKAVELCSRHEGMGQYFFFDDYSHLIESEWGLVEKNAANKGFDVPNIKCAFLGSGALPISAMMLGRHLNTAIHCVDCDTEANTMARSFVKAENKDSEMVIHDAMAESFDYLGFDLAVIASLIKPKEKVIAKLSADGVRSILVRTVDSAFSPIYEPVDEEMLAQYGYEVVDRSGGACNCMHKTLYAVKR